MYKEKLREIIVENYIQDKIDEERFINLSEKAEKVSESKAEKILNEVNPAVVGAAIGAVTGVAYGLIIRKIIKDMVTGKRYCKTQTEKITDKTLRKNSLYKCQIKLMNKAINALKKEMINCKNLKNEEKCRRNFIKTIKYYTIQQKKIEGKLNK